MAQPSPLPYFHATTLRPDILSDLRESFEKNLVELEAAPNDATLIARLCANYEAIAQEIKFAEIELGSLMQGIYTIMAGIADKQLNFRPEISDLLLLAMERIQVCAVAIDNGSFENIQMVENARISDLLCQLPKTVANGRNEAMQELLALLAPEVSAQTAGRNANDVYSELLALWRKYDVHTNADLLFFLSLATPAEARSRFWLGKNRRVLLLALAMNRHAREPVDPAQLSAAALVHDIGMSFLPLDILHKSSSLSESEDHSIHKHTSVGSALLINMPEWQESRRIIDQHHEHVSGKGYPIGLRDREICDGAKIIAIADAFEAISHPRIYSSRYKRPFIRAVLEINSRSGSQFSQKWVDVFNAVIRPLKYELY
ncbi:MULTISPECIES: HD-GYP domain-containing protein [unclassified Hahella]|uniref:HD-GYP domain-containing protein n=1 Tax=unclassified Hahella TaxID=2624107 RepID=UPI001C1ED420|nr:MULTISPECIES: HD domain-containing phosphohydrolase [unclassified Hahella]MBU6952377.1 HD domain-containing protein [Hahella sp. HN01]MDG9668551.1 HD domain-containing protein [Hahella sp. CR1]